MLTIGIDCGDQLRNGHATLAGDLLQTVPELAFKADARLVACNSVAKFKPEAQCAIEMA